METSLPTCWRRFVSLWPDGHSLTPFCQVYGFVLSCMLYRDGNTVVAAMEAMNSLLLCPPPAFSLWLMAPQVTPAVATDFWRVAEGSGAEGKEEEDQNSGSDAHSLREVYTYPQ